jgi:hypothetical protein
VYPWLLVQVALVKFQLKGTLSVTEYGVTPGARPPLSNVTPSVRLNGWLMLPEPPLRVKLKLVGSPDGLVSFVILMSPGTATAIPGSVWHLHFDGDPGNACMGLVHTPFEPGCRQLRHVFMLRFPVPVLSMQSTWRF